jgi:hypothetical protein
MFMQFKLVFKLYFLLSIIFCQQILAQEVFKVWTYEGSVNFDNGNQIVVGNVLNVTDKIKLGDSSYIALIHYSGKTLELKTKGTFKIGELSAKLNSGNQKYNSSKVKYIFKEFTDDIVVDLNNESIVNSTSHAQRSSTSNNLSICLPQHSYVLDTTIIINWKDLNNYDKYNLELSDLTGDKLLEIKVSDTKAHVNLKKVKKTAENIIYVKLIGDSKFNSNNHTIRKLDKLKNASVFEDMSYYTYIYKENTSINHLIKAMFYSKNNLFLNAKKEYELAVSLEPSLDIYKKAYRIFLAKNNLMAFYPY